MSTRTIQIYAVGQAGRFPEVGFPAHKAAWAAIKKYPERYPDPTISLIRLEILADQLWIGDIIEYEKTDARGIKKIAHGRLGVNAVRLPDLSIIGGIVDDEGKVECRVQIAQMRRCKEVPTLKKVTLN